MMRSEGKANVNDEYDECRVGRRRERKKRKRGKVAFDVTIKARFKKVVVVLRSRRGRMRRTEKRSGAIN